MRWMIVLSVLLFSLDPAVQAARDIPALEGAHAGLTCEDCHGSEIESAQQIAAMETDAAGCTGCHQGYERIFAQAMTRRTAEKQFAHQAFDDLDSHFFTNNCNSCHISDCLDCHGEDGHKIAAPRQDACLSCHRDYFVGREFLGMAPREDHPRYQRGPEFLGQHSLKMRPDVHAEAGLECRDCHGMQSLIAGEKSGKNCRDCHTPDPAVIEHGITAHLEKLECYACHSAWAPQEYGTFYLRVGQGNEDVARRFMAEEAPAGDYLMRAYLRTQGTPPLGYNSAGLISPIRPQFIAYYSDLRPDGDKTVENRLLSARWKAFFPHTIRRGTVMCDSCHDERRRYLLEKEEDRIYRIDLDGLGLSSFWNSQGQQIINGSFVSPQKFSEITKKDAAYTRAYVQRWKKLLGRDADSSRE